MRPKLEILPSALLRNLLKNYTREQTGSNKTRNGYKLARETWRKEETHNLIEFSRFLLLNPYRIVASRSNRFLCPYKSFYFQGYATIPMVMFRASATCACNSSILSAFAVTRKNTDACVLYMSAKLGLTSNRRFNSRTKQFHHLLSYCHFFVHSSKKSRRREAKETVPALVHHVS